MIGNISVIANATNAEGVTNKPTGMWVWRTASVK